jgi:hypothetical protein
MPSISTLQDRNAFLLVPKKAQYTVEQNYGIFCFMASTHREGTFCNDCEFAGEVSEDAVLAWSSSSVSEGANFTVVFDTQLNMSKGIVDMDNPEQAPTRERISALCAKTCIVGCALDKARLMAIDMTDDLKREAMLGLLNSYPGVSRLGEVAFINNGDDEKAAYVDSDAPGIGINQQ